MWTVEANFKRLWLNLGLIFNTSEVCYRLPAHKNFITTIKKNLGKKPLDNKESNFVSTDRLVIKHSVKKNMLILSGSTLQFI